MAARAESAEILLAEKKGTLISLRLARLQLSYLLVVFRQRTLEAPAVWGPRCVDHPRRQLLKLLEERQRHFPQDLRRSRSKGSVGPLARTAPHRFRRPGELAARFKERTTSQREGQKSRATGIEVESGKRFCGGHLASTKNSPANSPLASRAKLPVIPRALAEQPDQQGFGDRRPTMKIWALVRSHLDPFLTRVLRLCESQRSPLWFQLWRPVLPA